MSSARRSPALPCTNSRATNSMSAQRFSSPTDDLRGRSLSGKADSRARAHPEPVLLVFCGMQGRENWQALQARLTAARLAADRGDRDMALAEVAAALELDPNFLAAHELRDRVLAEAAAPVAPPAPAADQRPPAPDVSADGFARFQQRTMRRRLENRVEAARDAIERGRMTDAAAALDEVI